MPYTKQLSPDDASFLTVAEQQQYHEFRLGARDNEMMCALIHNEALVTVFERRLRRALAERDALQAEVSRLRQDLATLRAYSAPY